MPAEMTWSLPGRMAPGTDARAAPAEGTAEIGRAEPPDEGIPETGADPLKGGLDTDAEPLADGLDTDAEPLAGGLDAGAELLADAEPLEGAVDEDEPFEAAPFSGGVVGGAQRAPGAGGGGGSKASAPGAGGRAADGLPVSPSRVACCSSIGPPDHRCRRFGRRALTLTVPHQPV
ncbi:hypothetical protein [Actinoplanes sp. NPDC023714]|uniref:hypothetical protein n=1 Tax=Actinoplanes sp. NPDC023714 TaxID=3154322 RepID=UPI0033C2A9F0